MPSPSKQPIDGELMFRYLLSELPEQETERLDELSIADEEFSWRLSAAEDDLIDGYLRGEFSEERRNRFKSLYLSPAATSAFADRREKVAFAEALLRQQQSAKAPVRSRKRVLDFSWNPWLRFAAAAVCLVLLTAGYFLYRELRLQSERKQSAAMQPNSKPATQSETSKAVAPPVHSPRTVAFLLVPTTRAPGPLPRFALTTRTDAVLFRLQLELDEYPLYRATLTDLGSRKALWRSGLLRAVPHGKDKEISLSLPATVLSSRNYSFDLSGVPAAGSPELIGSYPFNLVIR